MAGPPRGIAGPKPLLVILWPWVDRAQKIQVKLPAPVSSRCRQSERGRNQCQRLRRTPGTTSKCPETVGGKFGASSEPQRESRATSAFGFDRRLRGPDLAGKPTSEYQPRRRTPACNVARLASHLQFRSAPNVTQEWHCRLPVRKMIARLRGQVVGRHHPGPCHPAVLGALSE